MIQKPSEFCAVVLAGGNGHKMKDLTESCPKFLMPVANRPMIFYPIRAAVDAGFDSITVIVSEKDSRKLKEALKILFSGTEMASIKLCTINADDDLGTLEAVLQNKKVLCPSGLWKHLCVFSCDSITDFSIQSLCDLNRIYECPIATALSKCHLKWNEIIKIGTKVKSKKKFFDVIGLDESRKQICFYQTDEEIQDQIVVGNISELGKIKLHTQLIDPHIYVISSSLLQEISEDDKLRDNLTRIKSEAIPYIVKKSDYGDISLYSDEDCKSRVS